MKNSVYIVKYFIVWYKFDPLSPFLFAYQYKDQSSIIMGPENCLRGRL